MQSALDETGHHALVRDGLLGNMEALIVETFHALRARVGRPPPSQARHEFELLGFDFLVDSTNKIWMLEVNLNPSITCAAARSGLGGATAWWPAGTRMSGTRCSWTGC